MSVPVIPAPTPPYRGPAKFHGGAQADPVRIVIHGTVSPTVTGGAEATARYFRSTVTRPSSAHYVVDPGTVVQVVFDHVEAYHAPPNDRSIGIELCDPVEGPAARWNDLAHRRMVRRAAKLTARLAVAYGVPIVKVGPDALKSNGGRGICGHVDVSNAWHQTTHWDPGPDFPWDRFMRITRRRAALLRVRYGVHVRK